jgi:hypothetical protein
MISLNAVGYPLACTGKNRITFALEMTSSRHAASDGE